MGRKNPGAGIGVKVAWVVPPLSNGIPSSKCPPLSGGWCPEEDSVVMSNNERAGLNASVPRSILRST